MRHIALAKLATGSQVTRRAITALAATMLAAPVGAQATSGDGYLFGQPLGTLTVRAGFAQPFASSDLFNYTTNLLSLRRRDFGGAEFGVDVGFMQGRRLEWLVSADVSSRTSGSDYRNFVGSDGLPIEQQTTFVRVPVMFGARYWLTPPGTSIGTLAWVPSRIAPFVAVQGGVMWYEFHQSGDFVNFSAGNSVFAGDLTSNGWAPTAALSAGVAVALNPHFSLLTQGRYIYANKTLSADFTGFQPIDLSGLSMTVGLSYRMR